MLTREAIDSSIPLAQKFDAAKLVVEAVENSPLQALVVASRSAPEFMVPVGSEGAVGYDPDVETMLYMANKQDELGGNRHNEVMDEVTEVVSEAVLKHLNFAKTVVSPLVTDLAERVIGSLNELSASSLLGMEVVVVDPPLPLTNPLLESSISRFENVAWDNPPLRFNLPSKTASEIIELMKVGTVRLDKDIEEWVATKGTSFVLGVWEKLFQQFQIAPNDPKTYTFRDFADHPVEGQDYSLAIYLLARNLEDNPPEGVEMSAAAYSDLMVQFRNQAGQRLVHYLDKFQTIVKTGQLVVSSTDRQITVNGAVYRQWIEAGGENEVLFGNMLTRPVVSIADAVTARAEEFKKAWDRHSALVATVESNKRFNRIKDILGSHFRMQLSEDGDETVLASSMMIQQKFNDLLAGVREEETQNVYELCLKLVCRSRFPSSAAEEILMGIENAKRENPNLDIREAATVATYRYIASWVASQFKVVPA